MTLDLQYYLAVLLRRLHYVAILFAAVTAAAVVVAFRMAPIYESTAQLLLQSQQIPDALAAPTVDTAALEQLQIVEQRLMTRQNLLDIARKFNVLPDLATMSPDDIVTAMRKNTTITKTAGRDQASMMIVSFDAPRAETAAAVVNEYVTRILADNTATRTGQAQDTLQFFRQEVDRLSADLSTQSAKILDFQNKNADALPDTLSYRMTQQSNLQERLAETERSIAGLKDQKQRLIDLYRSTGQVDTAKGPAQPTPEAQQLAQLQLQLSQAQAVFAADNPKVKMLQAQVDDLQARVAAQAQAAAEDAAKNTDNGSGTQSQGGQDQGTQAQAGQQMSPLDVQTAQIDAQIAQLTLQSADIEKTLAALKDSIDRSAGVAVQLQALQRDYDNIQAQYNTATDRLSKASTGERIEVMAKGQQLTVLDAAAVPNAPIRPNRVKIALLGAGLGLAAGLGFVVLLEMLNSSVRRPIDLERGLEITPIGTIPYVRTPAETLRIRLATVLAVVVVVAGLPSGVYLVDRYYMPIDLIVTKINTKLGL